MPRRASISARSCGVETITAPVSGTCCAIVSCASPVPGGMSTTRYVELAPLDLAQHLRQRRDHHRPAPDHRRLLVDQEADRHDREAVARDRLEPRAAERLRTFLDREQRRQRRPVDVGVEHADLQPERARPSARLTAVVDLPTPPLPEATAMIASTPGTPVCARTAACAARRGAAPAAGRRCAQRRPRARRSMRPAPR